MRRLQVTVSKTELGREDIAAKEFSGAALLGAPLELAPLPLWLVTVENGQEAWRETFGSEDMKNAFLRGLRSATSMLGHHGILDVHVEERTTQLRDVKGRQA